MKTPILALLLGSEVVPLEPGAAPAAPYGDTSDAVGAFWATLAASELARASEEAAALYAGGDRTAARRRLLDAATQWESVIAGTKTEPPAAALHAQLGVTRAQAEVWDYLADPASLQSELAASRRERADAIEQLNTERGQVESLTQQLAGMTQLIAERERELAELLVVMTEADRVNAERSAQMAAVQAQLAEVYAGVGWGVLTRVRNLVESMLPLGTHRRGVYHRLSRLARRGRG